MRVLAELVPSLSSLRLATEIAGDVNGFDLPESPVGYPSANSVVIGALIKRSVVGKVVISHVRLSDVNHVALASLAKGAEVSGIDGLLMTLGDEPKYGFRTSSLSTEEALSFLREVIKVRIKLGAVISLRYDLSDIVRRLERPFDFYLILRLSTSNLSKLEEVSKMAAREGKELYAYVIVSTGRNLSVVRSLGQPYVGSGEVRDFLQRLEGLIDSAVISVPGDVRGLTEVLRLVTRR